MPNTKLSDRITESSTTEHLLSSEVTEILSQQPSLIVRWGITVFFLILLGMFVFCWFLQYPELVSTQAKLFSVNAPKEIITHTDGRLMKIAIKENDAVHKGQILAYMESLANPTAVQKLSSKIDSIKFYMDANQTDEIIQFFPNYQQQAWLNQLGEVQTSFQTFIQAFITFKDFLYNGFYLRKRKMLQTDLQNIQKLHAVLLLQKELLQKDLSLSTETFQGNALLAKEKVISAMDYRTEESKLIGKKLSLPQINASILTNEGQQNEKRKEIAELENQILVQKNTFIQALQTIKTELQVWEYKYILKASVGGTVSFSGFFQENQEIKLGQTLFYIKPINTAYFLEMLVPQYNFGRVKVGQTMLLKFAAYPHEQYGTVTGKIASISSIPTDTGYLAKVVLPNGLVTNYKQVLHYHHGLHAQADIVTDNRRLLERFYSNMRKQLTR
ncbi:MAG: HlyD family efflux transporter periplasmic adaptor subunit [Bacteroidetes bacterium]|nr:MAG: HlyD family efflux transporter periplasmic adaptor subunit [Bacteroidota bacterium]